MISWDYFTGKWYRFLSHISHLFQLSHQWEQGLKVGHIRKMGSETRARDLGWDPRSGTHLICGTWDPGPYTWSPRSGTPLIYMGPETRSSESGFSEELLNFLRNMVIMSEFMCFMRLKVNRFAGKDHYNWMSTCWM